VIFGKIDRLPRLVTFSLELSDLPPEQDIFLLLLLPLFCVLVELGVEFSNLLAELPVFRRLRLAAFQQKSRNYVCRGLELFHLFIP